MDEQYIIDLKVKTPGVTSATKKIKELEAEMAKLEKTSESYKQKQIEIGRVQNAAGQSTKKLGSTVSDTKGSIGGLSKGLGLASTALAGSTVAVTALAAGLVAVGVVALDAANEFKALEKQLKSTGAQGATLKQLGNDAKFLKDNFNIDGNEFAASVNNLVQNFGLTTQEAAAAIKEAAIAGGNATGSLTSSINEFSTQAAAGGKTADQFFDSIIAGSRLGDFQLQALLDSSKEVTLRFKENTKATRDALKPLGKDFTNQITKDFESGGKNIDEVLLSIIERGRELNLTNQETQTIIADLGGGPLENLGDLDQAYKVLTDSVNATKKATAALTTQEVEANTRAERKIALQRELADTVGNEVLRVQNALTDAVFEVLEAIDTSGDGLKGLADDVIEFIDNTKDFVKGVIIAFQDFKDSLSGLADTARITFAIMTGGISELLINLPDVIKGFNDATGASDRFNQSQNQKESDRNSKLLVENLDEVKKKYDELGGTASRAINEIVDKEKSIIKLRESQGGITEKDRKREEEATRTRVGIIEDGEKKKQSIIKRFSGKISEDQQKELNDTLDFYIANNEAIATDFSKLDLKQKAIQDKGLQDFLDTLILKEKKTKDTNTKIAKSTVDTVQLEIDAFNKLKKSFEDNFETQRLEAQKLFLNGLITEEELQQKSFAINQQESDVIITITANKKEIAKTGRESLEISEEEVKKLKGQAEELDRQLAIRQKIKDAERSIQDSEFSSNSSQLRIEEEAAVQEILSDSSIQSEIKRQKAIEAVRKEFANRQRQLSIQDTQRQIADAQKAANELQASIGPTFDDNLSPADAEKNAELADYIAKIQQLKAELGLLNTQQAEANRTLTTDPEISLVERAEQYNSYIQAITQGLQEAVQADIAATDAKLNAQEARIQAGVELAKTGNDELLNQELERQEELLEERERFANQEKAIAAIQVAANLAVAVAKAAAQGGGIGSPANIALVLGAAGIGLASISGLVAGAFADGVINFQGKGTERSDSNIVAISKGESVITAKGTRNASKMLTMINEGKLSDSDYLTAGLDLNPIQTVNQQIDMRNELNEQIALSAELLEEMRQFHTKISFTDKGIEQYMQTKNKRITKINNR